MKECAYCGRPFRRVTQWQRFCSGKCRKQSKRKTPRDARCHTCGKSLTGKQRRWCSRACRYLGEKKSRLAKCTAPGCPRHGNLMVQRLDPKSAAYVCAGCGQTTPAGLVGLPR